MARRQGPREVYRVAGLIALIKDHQLACSEGCQSHVRRKTAPILDERGPSVVQSLFGVRVESRGSHGTGSRAAYMRRVHGR